MIRKSTYRGLFGFAVAVILGACWVGTAQAVNVVFKSGDGTCAGGGECVNIGTTTQQPGYQASTAPNTKPLNGNAATFEAPHPAWYQPGSGAVEIPGGISLNQFLTNAAGAAQTATWVSYTNSGFGPHPDLPAVPNYCLSSAGGPAPHLNPGGAASAPCFGPVTDLNPNNGQVDERRNQHRPAPTAYPSPPAQNDTQRVIGNQTAHFTEAVNVGPGTFNLEFYVWTDDTSVVRVTQGGVDIPLSPSNPFDAPQTTSPGACIASPISCPPGTGVRFTSNGLSGGGLPYVFNFYSFQIGSDVFGTLWGGAFLEQSQIPEPTTVLLLGSGLIGLGLLRRRQVS